MATRFTQQPVALTHDQQAALRAAALRQRVGTGLLGRVLIRHGLAHLADPEVQDLITDEATDERSRRQAAAEINLSRARAAHWGH